MKWARCPGGSVRTQGPGMLRLCSRTAVIALHRSSGDDVSRAARNSLCKDVFQLPDFVSRAPMLSQIISLDPHFFLTHRSVDSV